MNEFFDQPGFSGENARCVYCDADGDTHIVIGPANVLPAMAMGFVIALTLAIAVVLDCYAEPLAEVTSHIKLKRRCRQCGGVFWERAKLGKEPECGQCGYNLTGNVSGRCPECGWKLTRKMKMRVRLKTRAMKNQQ